jgi:hypothetical protein
MKTIPSGGNRAPRATSGRLARRFRVAAITTTAIGATLGATLVGTVPAQASSHREAPLIAGDPRADNTDVYAFVSPDKPGSVNLIANWIPFEEPNGGPNFYPFEDGTHYDINIDNNGNAKPDVIYRWTFKSTDLRGTNTFLYNNGPVTSLNDQNLLYRQSFTLTRYKNGKWTTISKGPVAPSNVGKASMPNYRQLRDAAITRVNGGGQTFAGQADDPFFLDLRVFDLLYGGNLSEVGQDTLKGYNVNSVALQVPAAELALNNNAGRNPVIGIWSSTSKQSVKLGGGKARPYGGFSQVSRLGNPLVNEVVLPVGLKDAFNSIRPAKDADIPAVVQRVTDPELPKLIQGIYGIPAPKGPRNDLVEIYLTGIAKNAPTLDGTKPPIQADLNSQVLNKDAKVGQFRPSEMLRLNTAVPASAQPNRLGVLGGDLQGFPNGRRLTDDVVDISIQAVEGAAVNGIVPALATGDKVDSNDNAFGKSFPYLALPNTNAVNQSSTSRAAASGAQPGAFGNSSGPASNGLAGAPTGSLGSAASGTSAGSAASGTGAIALTSAAVDSDEILGMDAMIVRSAFAALAAAFLGAGLFIGLRRRNSLRRSRRSGRTWAEGPGPDDLGRPGQVSMPS